MSSTEDKAAIRAYYERNRRQWISKHSVPGHVNQAEAKSAWEAAKRERQVRREWDKLQMRGVVDFSVKQDPYMTFEDYEGDTFDVEEHKDTVPGGARTIKADEKRVREAAEREGFYYMEGSINGEVVDNLGGFIGTEWVDLEIEFKAGVLGMLHQSWEDDQSGEH